MPVLGIQTTHNRERSCEEGEMLIWPEGAPGVDSAPDEEVETNRDEDQNALGLNRSISDVSRPTLTAYLPEPESATGVGVLVLPGGAWQRVVIDKEGIDVARWLQSRGIAGFVVKYRTAPKGDPAPVQDVREAVQLVRSRAEEWGVDPQRIGLLGFSAGGHIAVSTVLAGDDTGSGSGDDLDATGDRPDFVAAIYPAIPEGIDARSVREAPPVFLVHAADDRLSPQDNSVRLYGCLSEAGVPTELHVYARGGHGFGLGVHDGAVTSWPDCFLAWLETMGFTR